jgi:transcriptional regulator with XRE-family HTH domain
LFVLDTEGIKAFIELSGLKQKAISEKAGISETALSLILQGKRRCEIGEYATICWVLNVSTDKFLQQRMPEQEGGEKNEIGIKKE